VIASKKGGGTEPGKSLFQYRTVEREPCLFQSS
jgi:hypothetical protein